MADDELAATIAESLGSREERLPRLGRYRIEGVIGSGGMGVVHAAWDSELERRVALKVLNHTSVTASQRLLREARAMAKLSHPNVMTVHDAGTVDGRDFVAMELVDGETLADWLRAYRRGWRDIVTAFLAAGRGLAAAHAAGMIHRDFKPANVLRSHAGRILVTDFGLARSADSAEQTPSEPKRIGWVDLTATGTIMGTPAYMAPEQWEAGTITPATDQFAYCVAFWEGLAGKRPYVADDTEKLHAQMIAGPSTLDDSHIPRPLRAILRRGLMPKPADRWPSMDALLAAVERATRRRTAVLAIAGGVLLLASVILYVALRDDSQPRASSCPAPPLDPKLVWSDARAAAIRARSANAATILENDIKQWSTRREGVCAAPKFAMSAKLACLDAVLARIDSVARSAEIDKQPLVGGDIGEVLVDPAQCTRMNPPRVGSDYRDDMDKAFSDLRAARRGVYPQTLPRAPCALAITLVARSVAIDVMPIGERPVEQGFTQSAIADAAARCDDDFLKALAATAVAEGTNIKTIEPAAAAADLVPQADVTAEIDLLRAQLEIHAERWDRAIELAIRARSGFESRHRTRRQVAAVIVQLEGFARRGTREDLEQVISLAQQWRLVDSDSTAALDLEAARAHWRLGDVARAKALFIDGGAHAGDRTPTVRTPSTVKGRVVDESGAPVANADVVVGGWLSGDSAGLAAPVSSREIRTAKTDASGAFVIPDAYGHIAARSGPLRTVAPQKLAPEMTLVVSPTSRLEGTVDLAGQLPTDLVVAAALPTNAMHMVAPVDAKGAFVLDGAPRMQMTLTVRSFWHLDEGPPQTVVVDRPVVSGIELAAPTRADLWVIARPVDLNTPRAATIYLVYRAVDAAKSLEDLGGFRASHRATPPPLVEALPETVRAMYKPDDVVAHIRGREPGVLTACASPVLERGLKRDSANSRELACRVVQPDEQLVVIELPVLRRK